MTLLPIVTRELRVRARGRSTHVVRFGMAVAAIGLVIFLLVTIRGTLAPGAYGLRIFQLLSGLALGYCVVEGTRQTADCVSGEKRRGTLGLLFLTDLRGYDVILGKLTAASLNTVYGMLAVFPALAIPLLVGGVMVGEFWRVLLALVNALGLGLTAGMFVSTISRRERRAWGGALLLVGVVAGLLPAGPWLVGLLAQQPGMEGAALWRPVLEGMMLLSPTTAYLGAFDGAYAAAPERFRYAMLGSHGLSWLLLGAASGLLPLCWRERTPVRRCWARWGWFVGVRRAGEAARGRRRSELLDRHPLLWLAGRGQSLIPRCFLWVLVWVAGSTALIISIATEGTEMFRMPLVIGAMAFHLVLTLAGAVHSCYLLAGIRQSGWLELLLSTPLTGREIADGYLGVLRQRWYRPVAALVSLELLTVAVHLWGVLHHGEVDWAVAGLVGVVAILLVLVLDLYAVSTYGLWLGLSLGRPASALVRTVGLVMVLPHLVGLCLGTFWPVMGVLKNMAFAVYGREQLRSQLRNVATEAWRQPGGAYH